MLRGATMMMGIRVRAALVGVMLSLSAATGAMILAAATLYALGKTFFWPTMLAVASDRFPRTGAVAISIMGGIGMMSGGVLGGLALERASFPLIFSTQDKNEGVTAFLEKRKANFTGK